MTKNLLQLCKNKFPDVKFELLNNSLFGDDVYCGDYNLMEDHINHEYGMTIYDIYQMIEFVLDNYDKEYVYKKDEKQELDNEHY